MLLYTHTCTGTHIHTAFSSTLRGMLKNKYLQDLLLEIDRDKCPQLALRRAMDIPVFTEFADECLRVCGCKEHEEMFS